MPPADSGPPRRPGLAHRHSAGSVVAFAKSPHDTLSSSATKQQRPAKHVVGTNRLGSRNPSFGKNLNKLQKLTSTRPTEADPTSPSKPSHVKRNSSNVHLDRVASSTALRKNHSETSLKKNRSSGQLTKLTRPPSSRNVASKASKSKHRRSRTSLSNIQVPEGPANPTVRFDLGHEDEAEAGEDDEEEVSDGDGGSWAYTDSRSPSTTRNSTRRNSLSSQHHPDQSAAPDSDPDQPQSAEALPPASPGILRTSTAPAVANSAAAPHIMNRLLKRNVSFTNPTLSSNPATPVMIDPHQPVSQSHNTLNDSSNPEVVSRFLTQSTSTSNPSRESSFLPRATTTTESQPASPEKSTDETAVDDDRPRRNKSTPNFGAPNGTPRAPISRTQQRLNLDREAVSNRTPTGPPRSLESRASRLSAANIPFLAANAPGAGITLHIRQLNDRAAVEYRRVRLYQNPLLEALSRLRGTLDMPLAPTKDKPPAGKAPESAPKPPRTPDPSTKALSSSWKSARSALSSTPTQASMQAPPKTTPKRSRVTFQGLRDEEGDDDEKSVRGPASPSSTLGGAVDERDRERDEVRELCAKLWVRNDTGLAPAD